jgi:broad specificity phosphatase PhoE
MSKASLLVNPKRLTEVFLILHERAHRPEDLEYEYMTGKLAEQLEQRAFGPALTAAGRRRARQVGKRLGGLGLSFMVTDPFITVAETAKVIASAAEAEEAVPVTTDRRIRESDLSYLTRRRFESLGRAEAAGDPNATIRDWLEHRPEDFADLVSQHTSLWNQLVEANSGKKFALVLHVEGFLLYPTLLLGSPPERMVCLHVPRAHPVHVRLFPDRLPLTSLGDEWYWNARPATLFGQYG